MKNKRYLGRDYFELLLGLLFSVFFFFFELKMNSEEMKSVNKAINCVCWI